MIERKYAAIARREAHAIAEGRQWYPMLTRPALNEMGWLCDAENLFDMAQERATPIQPMDMNQVLTALAMVIAVAESRASGVPLPSKEGT